MKKGKLVKFSRLTSVFLLQVIPGIFRLKPRKTKAVIDDKSVVEKWDAEHNSFNDLDPVELIKALMKENNLRSKDLVEIMELSKGTISKILNYHKGLSKETIRKISAYFKVSQEAFNRPYKLVNKVNRHFRNANLMNTEKDLGNVVIIKDI